MHTCYTMARAIHFVRPVVAAVALWFALRVSASDAAVINVGQHILLANTPGQTIALQVTGGEYIAGLDFFAQIGDGGPELVNVGLPAGTDGPAITDVDLKTQTVFDATPAIQVDQPRSGVVQVFFASIALTSPPPGLQTVPAAGYFATLTVDTTGITSGTFDLLLSGVLPDLTGGPFATQLIGSGGNPIASTIVNGSITIVDVPEGDYSRNGVVDTADYTVWRDTLGQNGDGLAADGNGDMHVDELDYEFWKLRFGNTGAGSSQLLGASVPEPHVAAFVMVAATLGGLLRVSRP